ncbi:MAG: hypothetical protein ACN6RH_18075 [Stenotrophomonas rhizophila]|uniref:hypothetical protein n=1 Tax=Stenotrophomonas rhizophila TaxID=216778 RepID=UPI003D1497C0
MFEYEDRFYNPRHVLSIGKVLTLPNGRGRFEVWFTGSDPTHFGYDSPALADIARRNFVIEVNKVNGVG